MQSRYEQPLRIPSSVTSSRNWVGSDRGRGLGKFRDFGDFPAQVDLYPDPIALGDLLLFQHRGIGQRERPGLSIHRLECDRPLGLIDTDDRTSKRGGGLTGKDHRQCGPEQTDCCEFDPSFFHGAPRRYRNGRACALSQHRQPSTASQNERAIW